jgi:hypothetical protein
VLNVQVLMRVAVLVSTLLCFVAASPVEPDTTSQATEIRIGEGASPHAPNDRVRAEAVEGFLAARQEGSIHPSMTAGARSMVQSVEPIRDEVLFAHKGQTIAAFDFHDESIETAAYGGFQVSVYLLLADSDGRVVESRDETLTFSERGGSTVCTGLRAVNVIAWGQEGVLETARSLEASHELDRAEHFLHTIAEERTHILSYSLADVERGADGKVVVQCLRFQANLGKRGFDVTTPPLVVSRGDSVQVESN